MFKFLKEKLKKAVFSIGKRVEEIKEEKVPEEKKKEEIKQKPEIKKEQTKEPKKEFAEEKAKEKKSFLGLIKEKITTTKISEDTFEDLFFELEVALLENNVALDVIDKIRENLKKELVNAPILRGKVEEKIKDSLKNSIDDLLSIEKIDLIKKIKESKKPFIICFFGINGSGKTTSIAKIANFLHIKKFSVVLAAADTFRAASIEQLKEWGKRLNIKVIAHDYGSDPASVAYDAISYAKAHNIEVILIDTAGRQHSNVNLIREMEKIVRIAKPNLKIFVGESIVGNDAIEQAQNFDNAIGIDGSILTKADIDEKGGAIVSISYITHKPILFLGTGQLPSDLKEFNKEEIIKNLGL